jgi:hypothetical protein
MKSTIAEFSGPSGPWDEQWDDLRERADSGFMRSDRRTMAVLAPGPACEEAQ